MSFAPFRWLALFTMAQVLPAGAATGEYGTTAGWGRMLLDRADRTVSIEVVGVNGHTCGVRGRLTGALLDRADAGENCSFQLKPKTEGAVEVVVDEASRDACHSNCGARAWFEGEYLPLPAACTRAGLQRQQDEGLRAYRGKRYEAALQLWSQGLATCEKTMSWSDVWRWRNDAAIAAAHADRPADCRRFSQAVLADVKGVTPEGQTEPFTFAPGDADIARPLIAAARHNLAKCGA